MSEYLKLGHMSPLNDYDLSLDNSDIFYLPHHAVFKDSSLTTKLRVVFDASAKTTNNLSLNDTLMVGPTIQQDLFSIMVRFRTHRYVLIADIEKMYRQIMVNPKDSNLQRIVWRDAPHKELRHYALRTVTYGTASASFLATRCLAQIAYENKSDYPIASRAIANDFYVDDLITGSDDPNVLAEMKCEIVKLLSRYGFTLHKWFSNQHKIMTLRAQVSHDFSKGQNVRTLGIQWNVDKDNFLYTVRGNDNSTVFNKRSVLSVIAGIYDPLGLIAPITFCCKHFVQQLWLAGTDWDEPLSGSLANQWLELYAQLVSDTHFEITRSVKSSNSYPVISLQLHGFAGASAKGYALSLIHI